MDDRDDPRRTRRTPITSIQFLWPGSTEDRKVYWNNSINTRSKDQIRAKVFPKMYLVPYMYRGHSNVHDNEWMVTIKVSNQSLGNVGVSKINMSPVEMMMLTIKTHIRTLNTLL